MTTSNLKVPGAADPGMSLDAMKEFVKKHFDDFVNRRMSEVALKNLSQDFLDHDEPYGESVGNEIARKMMEGLHQKIPDLHVTVLDSIAEGDKVMVRNQWVFTDTATSKRMEFHGFVLWRFANGKIVERWATITPPQELGS